MSVFLILTAYAFRTYEPESLESINEQFIRLLISTLFSTIIVAIVNSADNVFVQAYKLFPGVVLTYFTLPFINVLCYNITVSKLIKPKKYLVIGRKEEIGHILDEITEKSKGKYIFSDFVNPSPATVQQKITKYDNILVANFELYKHAQYLIEPYKSLKKIEYLSDLSEKVLKRIPLEVIDKFREYYELEFEKAKESPAKRILDIIGGIIGLIIFSPFILISSIIILLEDGTPVVFKQLRVGKDGKYFEFIKLRSLRNDGFDPNNPNSNLKDRLLKVGKIIRPTRIDESLQFWLVLKGKMSLVGPRPEMIEYHRMCFNNIPYYSYRLKLKPGLTGWAQINFSHTTTLDEYKRKTEYDLYYIKNRSTLLDLRILLQTIETIFWRRGAK